MPSAPGYLHTLVMYRVKERKFTYSGTQWKFHCSQTVTHTNVCLSIAASNCLFSYTPGLWNNLQL
uniref:Uncharacterized protein n=1 Tax=Anguilla anguilla TaxID=7936 RepID=A0A0E9WF18_ANGAN